MFEDPSSPIGDDLGYPLVYLGKKLKGLGHQVATIDMDDLQKFDAAIFLDHPTFLNGYYRQLQKIGRAKLYLFLLENAANRPDNYWKSNHKPFTKIFTYNPELVDNKKYFRFHLPNRIPTPFKINSAEKTQFCITIASQKYMAHPQEIYTERVNAIRWFEREHPTEFDLYGTGWNRFCFKGRLSRLNMFLSKFYAGPLKNWQTNSFPSYRGTVKSKNAVMRRYRFSICYENAIFPGYVTEKIFDSMFTGCIPVYLGAPDVANEVPANAFIDKRNFKTYDELYKFLKGMSQTEYENYLSAIENYINGKQIEKYGVEGFASVFLNQIIAPS
ncbi:MAG: hypothetical protein JWM68_603 [Verrucomicrobiales bacterium]|nr:hypothetical protein [Verrucomicrobiales bacterium]